MTATKLPREFGIVIRCDHGLIIDDGGAVTDLCSSVFQTANVYVRVNRRVAAESGWIRGGQGRKRHDICPAHAEHERSRIAKIEATRNERRAARDPKRMKSDA